jgi:hypothetical protein
MATPLINTLPAATYMFTDNGSGSQAIAVLRCNLGAPTGVAQPGRVYYSLTDLLTGHSSNSAPVLTLRQKPVDLVGSWLASTADMLLETDSRPPGAYARALDELKADLGVTLTYIARCLALQRSAIYRWYEGRQPHAANRSRLETVREFASAWRSARLPSLRNYWDTPVAGTAATLGQLLSADALDITALRRAIDGLVSGTTAVPQKAPRLGFPGRKRDQQKDRERLSVLIPPTSHEGDETGEQ